MITESPLDSIEAKSAPEIVRMLGSRFRDFRMRANMTQKELAKQAGVTVTTIHKFETGRANNISLGSFLRLLKAVGMIGGVEELLPDLPQNPYLLRGLKPAQRIRHPRS